MGEGHDTKTREEAQVEIQERGEIFFFYRPKVDREEAHGPDDVQRMYIVLRPESAEKVVQEKQSSESGKEGKMKKKTTTENDNDTQENDDGHEGGKGSEKVNIEEKPLLRFIMMGRKKLPDPSKRTRPYWGFVELVTTNTEDIKKALSQEEYETATKGKRTKQAARPMAEGVYRILKHQGKRQHTHLVYKLELPRPSEGEKENEPQKALNVEQEGSFIIQIKNPNAQRRQSSSSEEDDERSSSDRGGLQKKRKATFPASLQGSMGTVNFVSADPPDFLNYEGCEFILISASDDIDAELGLDVKAEDVEAAKSCSDLVKMFGEISSIKPLIEGTWA